MLRAALLLVAAALCAGGLLGWLTGHPASVPAAWWGGLLLAAVLFERWRYRPAPPPGAGWTRTEERFVDPETGATMQVWYDPSTGERRYVAIPPDRGA